LNEKKKKKKEITFDNDCDASIEMKDPKISFTSEAEKSKLVIDSSKDPKELSSIWWIIRGNCTSLSYRLNRNVFEYHFPNFYFNYLFSFNFIFIFN